MRIGVMPIILSMLLFVKDIDTEMTGAYVARRGPNQYR